MLFSAAIKVKYFQWTSNHDVVMCREVIASEPSNRPFYRYGGHIELIRFKEYYGMPRGHERILFVFSSAFRDIFFLKVFLE